MRITKKELLVIAHVIAAGEISIHYGCHSRDTAYDIEAARSLVKKGLLRCPNPSADYEKFMATRKGIRRMLHGDS